MDENLLAGKGKLIGTNLLNAGRLGGHQCLAYYGRWILTHRLHVDVIFHYQKRWYSRYLQSSLERQMVDALVHVF